MDKQVLEPTLIKLLDGIQRHGSLKNASEDAQISYRSAWGLLSKWEERLGRPLVVKQKGRGSTLAPPGELLLQANVQLNARFMPELENFALRFQREFEQSLNATQNPSVSIFASHGIAVGVLRDLIKQIDQHQLNLHYHGSIESLRALDHNKCDVAGFHIPIGALNSKVREQYLRWLDKKKVTLVYVVKRNQGLMVAKQNPHKVQSLSDLTNPSLRFINRQDESGTRLLFDQLLHNENISDNHINGYQNEEFTHMAVAAMIASGQADAGFGIAPMADRFDLDFIPLVWEHYCLAVPNQILNDPAIENILSTLQGSEFKDQLKEFRGYETKNSGKKITFEEIFTDHNSSI